MKLVIDVPEEVYKARKQGEISPWVTSPILDAVANGKPLDEAQPCVDCVSREAVLACEQNIWNDCGVVSVEDIKALPPVTPKQMTGKWVEMDTNMYSCSNCNHCFTIVPEDNNISQFKWCPHCGAKME